MGSSSPLGKPPRGSPGHSLRSNPLGSRSAFVPIRASRLFEFFGVVPLGRRVSSVECSTLALASNWLWLTMWSLINIVRNVTPVCVKSGVKVFSSAAELAVVTFGSGTRAAGIDLLRKR